MQQQPQELLQAKAPPARTAQGVFSKIRQNFAYKIKVLYFKALYTIKLFGNYLAYYFKQPLQEILSTPWYMLKVLTR